MADARMPEKFYELARPMLPAEGESAPQGGRPRIGHYRVLKVIWFVLVTGCRWKDVPQEMGCCGETARTRLQAWERAGIWDQLHKLLLTMLRQANELHLETAIIDSAQVRAFGGGDATGPSPVDRRKKGTKYTIMVDRDGVPLVLHAAAANRSDQLEILPTVVSYPVVPGKVGRPPTHPKKLYADAGYDCEATRSILRWMGIEPRAPEQTTLRCAGSANLGQGDCATMGNLAYFGNAVLMVARRARASSAAVVQEGCHGPSYDGSDRRALCRFAGVWVQRILSGHL